MAKSKKDDITTSTKEFSFLDLDKKLSKIPGFESGSILDTNTFCEVSEWIHTGSYIFNAQISGSLFGGIPNTRSVGLIGDPGAGKSFLCLNIAREAQKMGYFVVYCDTEAAMEKSQMYKFGIDGQRLRYQPIRTVNNFKNFTINLLDEIRQARAAGQNPKVMIILDSLGMMPTDKELRDALEGKNAQDMGLKAKELRALFRVITLDLAENKVPLIATNHTTTGIGGFMPTKESAGGDGPIFSFSVVSFLGKSQLKETDGTKSGMICTSRLRKTRFTRPFIEAKMYIKPDDGMNPYVGLDEYVNWDACGIQKGKIVTAKEFEKLKPQPPKYEAYTCPERVDKSTGEVTPKEDLVFIPSETGRWCVKHLGRSIVAKEFFTPWVFTSQVMKDLDEKVIQPRFKFPERTEHSLMIDETGNVIEVDEIEPTEVIED